MPLSSPVTDRQIIICRDVDELSRKAAEQFVGLARLAIAARDRFAVALSGGSTPKAFYSLLATAEFREQLDWRQIHLFFGDERCVAPDHAESNYRMVAESLLAKIAIPGENVRRMAGELAPEVAAAAYAAALTDFFDLRENQPPRFDLIFLGLGEDGHTASLFPDSSALHETQALVATTYVEKLKARRLTLTLPTINNAAQISFLVAGHSKAAVVTAILTGQNSEAPAARIKPSHGKLAWFITEDAAGDLRKG
jgi:6-phosphogluconolactonase